MNGDPDPDADGYRRAPDRDREIGMAYYLSETDGTGGRIKVEPADFRVEEISDLELADLDVDPDAYPHLVVRATLDSWDTHEFVDHLSDRLGISRRRITWAGTKDKHAVTTQQFAIRDLEAEALPDVSNATIEPVGRLGRPLTFGDLVGNRFEIRVRDPSDPGRHESITRELQVWEDERIAVPNFFGPQRFGSRRAITHLVGLAILHDDWEGAVLTYLADTDEAEPAETRAFREFVDETRDWATALERCPRQLGFERTLLSALVEHADEPDRFRRALDRLPETLQQLFVHAAQSYCFNLIVSERLRQGAPLHRALPGDVVCFGTRHPAIGPVPDMDRLQRVTDDRVETINRHIEAGRAWVTAPLVGTDVERGTGRPRGLVDHVIAEVGLDPDDFDLPEPYGSEGTRRSVLVTPEPSIEEGSLRFSFGLPSGAYATVVLREYLKADARSI